MIIIQLMATNSKSGFTEEGLCSRGQILDAKAVEWSYQSYKKSEYVLIGKMMKIDLTRTDDKSEYLTVTVNIDKVYKDKSNGYSRGQRITFKELKSAHAYPMYIFNQRDVRLIEKDGQLYSSGFHRTYKPKHIQKMLDKNKATIEREEKDPNYRRSRGLGI
jgi:hypothetical protein